MSSTIVKRGRKYIGTTLEEARHAHAKLPALLSRPGGVREWLLGARRAQLALGMTVVVGVWVLPPLLESVLGAVLPTSTRSSGFLGMNKTAVAHPAVEPIVVVFCLAFWAAGLVLTLAHLWRRIPLVLGDGVATSVERAPEASPVDGSSSAQGSAAGREASLAETVLPDVSLGATVHGGGGLGDSLTATHAMSDGAATELVPTFLAGRYAIMRQLGEGGMGQVFLAEDKTLGRLVALKKLPEELVAQEALRERFRREARALAQLNHPNVVQLFDFIEEPAGTGAGGLAAMWMVMEVVSGGDLEERLDRGPLDVSETARLGIQVASALAAAHERGIVHRDFKPANVMLTEAGEAKVTDFGIAKLEAASAGASTKLTQAGSVMGTPTYMSPEQAMGSDVGPGTDVYALGATFYEMLTGQPLFSGTLTQVLAAHVTEVPPRLDAGDWVVPAPLVELVARMLEKTPEGRPALSEVRDVLSVL